MSAQRLVYVARRECGCVTFIGIDNSRSHHQGTCRIAGCIVEGERVDRLPLDEARAIPWVCPTHARQGPSAPAGRR